MVYWLKAGQQALARSAMAEAVAQAAQGAGLAVRSAGRPVAPGTGVGPANPPRIGRCSRRRLWAAEAAETFARARRWLSNSIGPQNFVPLVLGQWHFTTRRRAQAGDAARRAARTDRRDARRHVAHNGWPIVPGDYLASISASSLPLAPSWSGAVALLIQCSGRATRSWHADHYVVSAQRSSTWILACLGYIDQARSQIDEALVSEARRLTSPRSSLAYALRAL